MTVRGLAAGLGLAALLVGAPSCAEGPPADERSADPGATAPGTKPPDVVLVLLDTLRPDHLELLGYEHATAPFLDALGRRGAVFEQAVSTSGWTPPSTASLVTGLYPLHHGVIDGFELDVEARRRLRVGDSAAVEVSRLPEAHPTLAERFAAAGYATVAVTTNVHINEVVGHDRGFDHFTLERDADAARVATLLAEAHATLADDDRPRFTYLHLNDVHRPYHEREPWFTPRAGELGALRGAYDSEIRFADEQLRAMAERFDWGADTLWCVVSDHGEGFGEGGLVGHGPSLSWVVNRCLFVLAGPGVPARRVPAPVSLVDVAPTLLELAGLSAPDDVDGVSLVPLLDPGRRREAEQRLAARPLFAHRRHRPDLRGYALWSVIQGRWKLIHDELDGSLRVYDLAEDPREQQAVTEGAPTDVLRALHAQHAQGAVARDAAHERIDLDPELYRHLQALGYAGDDGR